MIEVQSLVKTFDRGRVRAVDDVGFSVPSGKVLTLLGPSGCGKTTTMRSIAGLETPDSGIIKVGDRVVYSSGQRVNRRPNQRGTGMVFQSYAIWPHMTVFDNVAYPLQGTRGVRKATVRERTLTSLRLVGLEHLADRRAPNLSGGQQQRVALARALVAEPEVLLLDEPLSNLDAKLRESMRQEIRELQQKLGITTLFVTHDQMEALAISDLLAVMLKGKIIDFGPPERIYARPRSRSVAEFIGMANIVRLSAVAKDGDLWVGESPIGRVWFPHEGAAPEGCSVLIRLEDVQVVGEDASDDVNVWPGRVLSALYLGGHFDCVFDVAGVRFRAEVPRRHRPKEGDAVKIHVPPRCCYVLPEDDDQAPVAVGSGLGTVEAAAV